MNSNTYLEGKEKVMEGLEKGFFYRKEDNSVWAGFDCRRTGP